MNTFDYYYLGIVWDYSKNTLNLYVPLKAEKYHNKDARNQINRLIEAQEWQKKPYFSFEKWRTLKKYWQQTGKTFFVENKGNNYLSVRSEIFIIREEVKNEIEKVFWDEIHNYLEFLDVNLVDLKSWEPIINLWERYAMNVLKLIKWTWERDLKKDGKRYDPVFYKEQVINKQWVPKYPIFRMAERDNTPIISKEFKNILDKFDDQENAWIYFYKWINFKDDIVS